MNFQRELRLIFEEYKLYFPECKLHLQTCLPPSDDVYAKMLSKRSPVSHIGLTTLEGEDLKVAVCVAGWFELGKENYHPTFEALLDTLSPGFRNRFASELTDKLNSLS